MSFLKQGDSAGDSCQQISFIQTSPNSHTAYRMSPGCVWSSWSWSLAEPLPLWSFFDPFWWLSSVSCHMSLVLLSILKHRRDEQPIIFLHLFNQPIFTVWCSSERCLERPIFLRLSKRNACSTSAGSLKWDHLINTYFSTKWMTSMIECHTAVLFFF